MERIGIVVDSTADLPLNYYKNNNVKMVPLTTRFDEEFFKDWIELSSVDFYKKLRKTDKLPKTSQPTVGEFVHVYQELEKNSDRIVSMHISAKLSGTVQSAEIAAKEVSIPVEVIDTKTFSAGLALILDKTVEMREMGKSFQEIIDQAKIISENTKCIGGLSTIKYLKMGGRIGRAQAFVGNLLNFKPILTIKDGEIAPIKRVKGKKKIIPEIVNQIEIHIGKKEKVVLGVAHGDNKSMLLEFKERIESTGLEVVKSIDTVVGSVIGTYAGPDCLLVFCYKP